ncbi:MAG: aminodeoxychorismate/anthranilate synthase component II [Bacteroidota bacterium]
MRIAIVDNNDSFTYNLQHYVNKHVDNVVVLRSNDTAVNDLSIYDGIILSPGPGLPDDFINLRLIIEKFYKTIPILGICLGHQAIGLYFGARLKNLNEVYHGLSLNTQITDRQEIIFKSIPEKFLSGRYHSWVIDKTDLPEVLNITAIDPDLDLIMGIRHINYNIKGMQFHPESIMTENGRQIISNWIESIL